ncbi:MAG: hypothetical protein KDE19_18585 [Caldilineaceae bacterium]|nr:hypothetical protein [Caldilineaceae bacterium]
MLPHSTARWRQRLASLVVALIMAYIFLRILDRLFVVIWVQMPWWGLLLTAFVLYLVIDHLVRKVIE